jgi:hypothetical protein
MNRLIPRDDPAEPWRIFENKISPVPARVATRGRVARYGERMTRRAWVGALVLVLVSSIVPTVQTDAADGFAIELSKTSGPSGVEYEISGECPADGPLNDRWIRVFYNGLSVGLEYPRWTGYSFVATIHPTMSVSTWDVSVRCQYGTSDTRRFTVTEPPSEHLLSTEFPIVEGDPFFSQGNCPSTSDHVEIQPFLWDNWGRTWRFSRRIVPLSPDSAFGPEEFVVPRPYFNGSSPDELYVMAWCVAPGEVVYLPQRGGADIFPEEVRPTVVVARASGQLETSGEFPLRFDVAFSEPVNGFELNDVVVSDADAEVSISGGPDHYLVELSGLAASSRVSVDVPYGAATSGDGFPNAASTGVDNWVNYVSATCPDGEPRRAGDSNCDHVVRVAVLGDSYISGEGAFEYREDTDIHDGADRNLCHRSDLSWAMQSVQHLFPQGVDAVRTDVSVDGNLTGSPRAGQDALMFAACSGAVTDDFVMSNRERVVAEGGIAADGNADEPPQVARPSGFDGAFYSGFVPSSGQLAAFESGGEVDIVMVSIGGNDARFGDVILSCFKGNCIDGYSTSEPGLTKQWLDAADSAAFKVERALRLTRMVSPNAEIYMTAYPNPLSPASDIDECNSLGVTGGQQLLLSTNRVAGLALAFTGGGRISEPERAWLSGSFVPYLNAKRQAAAEAVGAHYVDNQLAFSGHPICDRDNAPWVHGLTIGDDKLLVLGNESFHPTPDGYDRWSYSFSNVRGSDLGRFPNPPPQPIGLQVGGTPIMVDVTGPQSGVARPGTESTISILNGGSTRNVRLFVRSIPVDLGVVELDANGALSTTIDLPDWLAAGVHTLLVVDADTGQPIASQEFLLEATSECPSVPGQADDADGDGLADSCDPRNDDGPYADYDEDSVINGVDNCPITKNSAQADSDLDGTGDACEPDNEQPIFVPTAPRSVTGVAGDGSVTVSWSAPTSDGGAAISSYEVKASPGGRTCSTIGARSCTVAGLTNGTPYTFTVRATNAVGTSGPSAASGPITPAGSSFVGLTPGRLFESRSGESTVDGQQNGVGRRSAGQVSEVQVAGRGGVPGDALAAIVNVTAIAPDVGGFITVFPCGATRPGASTLNYAAGQVVANGATIKLGVGGKICVFTQQAMDLIVDVSGFFPAGSSFVGLTPGRLTESRSGESTVDGQQNGVGRRSAGQVSEVQVAGRGGVPGDALAAIVNVTAIAPDVGGFITVFPCGATRPGASTLNYAAGQVVANGATIKLGVGGKICVFTQQAMDLIVDVSGYHPI